MKRSHFSSFSCFEDSNIALVVLFFHGGVFLFLWGVDGGEQILYLGQRIDTLVRTLLLRSCMFIIKINIKNRYIYRF